MDQTQGGRSGEVGKIRDSSGRPSTDPALAGERLHLNRPGNYQRSYYAHLTKATVKSGDNVVASQLLGFSGVANGVEHLHIALLHGGDLDKIPNRICKKLERRPGRALPVCT